MMLLGGIILAQVNGATDVDTQSIDREALVQRHTIHIDAFDPLDSLSVGNGGFAFTVDPTGLQSFPEFYKDGIPLGTQSEWGWHSFPNEDGVSRDETYRYFDVQGKKVPYSVQSYSTDRQKDAVHYFRQNPHRLHLGIIGLEFIDIDGNLIPIESITDIQQNLNMWTGTIHSSYKVEGKQVTVTTLVHPDLDLIAVKIESTWLGTGRLKVKIRFPYPTGGHTDAAYTWKNAEKHQSTLSNSEANQASILHKLDEYVYNSSFKWSGTAKLIESNFHVFELLPETDQSSFSFSCQFSQSKPKHTSPSFAETTISAKNTWQNFWSNGGAVDLSGSTDPRANELERRIILSQYLTRIQCAGIYPPQETGLTYNSWHGKFHLEMHWWHGVHWALWNRIDLLEKSLDWYFSVLSKAKAKARLQGYEGVRWAKMTDLSGNDSPSDVGEFLIWQQPHMIYFSELAYRHHQDQKTLEKYAKLVFETADFMVDFVQWDDKRERYILGPPLIPAQERLPLETTVNPPFELVYWHMGIHIAQEWRKRLGMEPDVKYKDVLDRLSVPTASEGKYLAAESAPDSYHNPRYITDHPMVLGAYGMLTGENIIDKSIMSQTFDHIFEHWSWEETWGWDYPLTAMSAIRLGKPDRAVDALLMDVQKNTYLKNGHNYQDERLRLYLPGNGGLLTVIAMMCAGFDGSTTDTPGFPEEGWCVKWEGLNPLP